MPTNEQGQGRLRVSGHKDQRSKPFARRGYSAMGHRSSWCDNDGNIRTLTDSAASPGAAGHFLVLACSCSRHACDSPGRHLICASFYEIRATLQLRCGCLRIPDTFGARAAWIDLHPQGGRGEVCSRVVFTSARRVAGQPLLATGNVRRMPQELRSGADANANEVGASASYKAQTGSMGGAKRARRERGPVCAAYTARPSSGLTALERLLPLI